MIKVAIILGLMILGSFVGCESSGTEKTDESKDTVESTLVNSSTMISMKKESNQKDTLSAHIDRVEILCLFFGKYHDSSLRAYISNSTLHIVSTYNERDTIYVSYGRNKSKLIRYINQLYIDKTNKIVSSTKSEKEQIEADYPFIRVIGRKEKTQVFKKDISLRNNIEFTSEFLEFYEFLDNLVRQKYEFLDNLVRQKDTLYFPFNDKRINDREDM